MCLSFPDTPGSDKNQAPAHPVGPACPPGSHPCSHTCSVHTHSSVHTCAHSRSCSYARARSGGVTYNSCVPEGTSTQRHSQIVALMHHEFTYHICSYDFYVLSEGPQ